MHGSTDDEYEDDEDGEDYLDDDIVIPDIVPDISVASVLLVPVATPPSSSSSSPAHLVSSSGLTTSSMPTCSSPDPNSAKSTACIFNDTGASASSRPLPVPEAAEVPSQSRLPDTDRLPLTSSLAPPLVITDASASSSSLQPAQGVNSDSGGSGSSAGSRDSHMVTSSVSLLSRRKPLGKPTQQATPLSAETQSTAASGLQQLAIDKLPAKSKAKERERDKEKEKEKHRKEKEKRKEKKAKKAKEKMMEVIANSKPIKQESKPNEQENGFSGGEDHWILTKKSSRQEKVSPGAGIVDFKKISSSDDNGARLKLHCSNSSAPSVTASSEVPAGRNSGKERSSRIGGHPLLPSRIIRRKQPVSVLATPLTDRPSLQGSPNSACVSQSRGIAPTLVTLADADSTTSTTTAPVCTSTSENAPSSLLNAADFTSNSSFSESQLTNDALANFYPDKSGQ
ncbi:unnamed protein product [Protopolystoma xenopodis]|uniref:Uncharacterized protein n=1 Tax=Protopolystoma xenopodis TaxID=117903 RepID=A0A448WAX1_9PLAT|nr:unnamed protein product [Protopolystoma xenopodis]